jgi:hypothetical protein
MMSQQLEAEYLQICSQISKLFGQYLHKPYFHENAEFLGCESKRG